LALLDGAYSSTNRGLIEASHPIIAWLDLVRMLIPTTFPRRIAAAAAVLLLALVVVLSGGRLIAAVENARPALTPAKPARPVSLRDRLVVGLRARLKSEIAFIDAVVLHVQSGRLPQRLVDQTFFWARERAAIVRHGRTRRPIVYFRPAMVARAKRLNVAL
jgi:hypothetical protein